MSPSVGGTSFFTPHVIHLFPFVRKRPVREQCADAFARASSITMGRFSSSPAAKSGIPMRLIGGSPAVRGMMLQQVSLRLPLLLPFLAAQAEDGRGVEVGVLDGPRQPASGNCPRSNGLAHAGQRRRATPSNRLRSDASASARSHRGMPTRSNIHRIVSIEARKVADEELDHAFCPACSNVIELDQVHERRSYCEGRPGRRFLVGRALPRRRSVAFRPTHPLH